ncbi:hypothetical protein ABIB95_005722 [Bradyrhizobium sp. LA2.1]
MWLESYRLVAHWGLSDMANVWRKEAIEQHAERINPQSWASSQ